MCRDYESHILTLHNLKLCYHLITPKRRDQPKGEIMAKKNKAPKGNVIIIDAVTVWESQKPRYNGFACGYGAHGKRKYDRNQMKRKSFDW